MNINCKHHDHRPIPKEDRMDIKRQQIDPKQFRWHCLDCNMDTSDYNAGLWHRNHQLLSLVVDSDENLSTAPWHCFEPGTPCTPGDPCSDACGRVLGRVA